MKKVFKKSNFIILFPVVFLILVFGISFGLSSGVGSASAETSIKDTNIVYNSVDKEIVISPEKVLDITETITVTFHKSGINLGLSRNVSRINKITTIYKGKKYTKRTVNDFKLLSVTLDGEKEYNFVKKTDDYFYINTGADGDYKSAGRHVYVIHYLLDMGEDLIKDFDSFTFDIMDYGFRSQVNHFSAKITFPDKFLQEGQNLADILTLRTNNMASLGIDALGCTLEGNTISCEFGALARETGFTMQLLLPQGYFHTYYAPNTMYWIVFSMVFVFVVAIVGIILFARLRKRKKMVVVPEFYPPKDMNALEIASAYRGRIKSKDFASLVISWASQDLIKIKFNERKKLILTRVDGVPINKDERKFFLELFDGENEVKINRSLKYNRSLGKTVGQLFKPSDKKAFMNWKFQLAIAILSFLPLIFYIGWGITIFGSYVYTCFFLIIFAIVGVCVFFYTAIPLWFKLIWCGGFAGAPLGIMTTMSLPVDYDTCGLIYMIIAFILAENFASRLLSYRNFTDKELSARPQILGFKQFLVTARIDELEMMLEENPNYYYDILPYCYIFGITKKMEEKFKLLHINNPDWVGDYSAFGACSAIGHSLSHSVCGWSSGGGSGGGGGGGGGSSGGGGGGGGCGGR